MSILLKIDILTKWSMGLWKWKHSVRCSG